MPCYSPLVAYQCANKDVVFVERSRHDIVRELQLPCGRCIGCRLERSRQWAMRCMHEAKLSKQNVFVTLTYADDKLPERGQLVYSDFQGFMKRTRKAFEPSKVRFYMCGEYGETTKRPHFHACLFGIDFDDKEYWRTTESGSKSYRSAKLERLWGHGHCEAGEVTFESAAYIARYCVQKVVGDEAYYYYYRHDANGPYQQEPEFNQASLKPGLGRGWYEKWRDDVFPHDYVVVNGQKVRPPKYYSKVFKKENPDVFEDIQARREEESRKKWADNTPDRLRVKEIVQKAQARKLIRGKI